MGSLLLTSIVLAFVEHGKKLENLKEDELSIKKKLKVHVNVLYAIKI